MAKIFIVEDDESLSRLYEKALILFGYDVLGVARDGQEAVDKFKDFKEKPDIILMDHRMPVKNGIQAAKEILELNIDVKIIFASADISVKEEALNIGIFKFKEKPFTIEKLIRNIEKALKYS